MRDYTNELPSGNFCVLEAQFGDYFGKTITLIATHREYVPTADPDEIKWTEFEEWSLTTRIKSVTIVGIKREPHPLLHEVWITIDSDDEFVDARIARIKLDPEKETAAEIHFQRKSEEEYTSPMKVWCKVHK